MRGGVEKKRQAEEIFLPEEGRKNEKKDKIARKIAFFGLRKIFSPGGVDKLRREA